MEQQPSSTEAIHAEVLTPTLFRGWVARHGAGAIVGTLDRLGENPLDRYIRDVTRSAMYMSSVSVISTDGYYRRTLCPDWAYAMQLRLFVEVPRHPQLGVIPVTREQVLDALDAALADRSMERADSQRLLVG